MGNPSSSGGESDESLSEGEAPEPCEWEDWNVEQDEDDDQMRTLCLFSGKTWDSPAETLEVCASEYGFDLRALRKEHGMDFYDGIRVINFVRKSMAAGRCMHCDEDFGTHAAVFSHMNQAQHFKLPIDASKWRDDANLTPVIQDDALLFGFEDEDDFEESDRVTGGAGEASGSRAPAIIAEDLPAAVVEAQAARLQQVAGAGASQSAASAQCGTCAEAAETRLAVRELLQQQLMQTQTLLDSMALGDHKLAHPTTSILRGKAARRAELTKEVDDHYFNSYSHFRIHREMISDTVRTDAYRDALEKNPSLIRGKTVLDVGCGTGILSMFAARAGAAKVLAVDGSSFIAEVARKNAAANGFAMGAADGGPRVLVLQGKMETLVLPEKQVDVIVSEWMGYALLYESMLDTVLWARDHYLKPGGALLPDTATIFMAGVSKAGTSLPFWDDVYGFDMGNVGTQLHDAALKTAVVAEVAGDAVVTETVVVKHFDLMRMTQSEVNFTSQFELQLKAGDDSAVWCYGVVIWFDTGFTPRVCPELAVNLSTSPHTKCTHWVQTLLHFRSPVALAPASSQQGLEANPSMPAPPVGSMESPATCVKGKLTYNQGPRQRNLDVTLEYTPWRAGKPGYTEVVMFEV